MPALAASALVDLFFLGPARVCMCWGVRAGSAVCVFRPGAEGACVLVQVSVSGDCGSDLLLLRVL